MCAIILPEVASPDGVVEPVDFEIWRPWAGLVFLKPNSWEYVLFVLGLSLSLAILYNSRRSFAKLQHRELLLLSGCTLAPVLVDRLFLIEFSAHPLLPPPGVPFVPPSAFASLLGAVPIAIAGAWLGPGSGLLVGLIRGVLRSGTTMGGLADPFHLAFFGFLIGLLLHQDYQGRLPAMARQPAVTLPLMTPVAALPLLFSSLARVAGSGLSGLDYAVGLTSAHLVPLLLESLVAALVVQTIYALFPRSRPIQSARRTPPYSRTLNRRLLFLFVPLIGLITVVLVYAATATALRVATAHAVEQMARDANHAANEIPYFLQTGQGLVAQYSGDPDLWRTDRTAVENRLRRGIQTVVFFDELLLFDAGGQLLGSYPPPPTGGPWLAPEEQILVERGLESGATQISSVHRSETGLVTLSFLAPMTPPATAREDAVPSRVLVGRTQLDINPIIGRVVAGLQWTDGRGEGFVVDSEGRIIAHPDANKLMTKHRGEEEAPLITTILGGSAYESRNPRDNTRELVYHLPVEGHPWAIVVRLPHTIVSEQATQIATPLLGLQVLMGGGLVIIISLVTKWLTHPLQQLAVAADRIAEGDLAQPVDVAGHDEVARVGEAFEDMRARLKERLEDLSLLLDVSQAVSATLELSEGIPSILDGVLRGTDAQVARIVFLSADGDPYMTRSCGEPCQGVKILDEALAKAARDREHPVVLENLARAKSLVPAETLPGAIKAVVALPIGTRQQVSAVMWVGYSTPRQIGSSEIDLLSTLAGQTAVLIENARLFQTAEGERRRLAATLASTSDAVLVTDRARRVLLINPAGERAFGVEAHRISGQRLDHSPLAPTLVGTFQEPLDPGEALTRELALPDGRTLCASVSAIVSASGDHLGRVAVIRDITQLKELSELKSSFVATVSHDLRGPLAFVRGYTTMLSSAGELNQRQLEYVSRILSGITRMSNLVEDLLNLGRIEAGVGIDQRPCHLGAVLNETVDTMRARAEEKGVSLHMASTGSQASASDRTAIVYGDATLLRQAITNLVENAIKYTPSNGKITVGLCVRGEYGSKQAVIKVSDNGIGIAPEDRMHLFEKFYRGKRSDVPNAPGIGLGLSLVKSIVDQHGGEVSVDSKLNEGSTFCVSLPLMDAAQADR